MTAAVDVREIPVPASARGEGQRAARAFAVAGFGYSIGIIWAIEPHLDNGEYAIHISCSRAANGRPTHISAWDMLEIERVIRDQGLQWPVPEERSRFQEGPFAGKGVHIWGTKSV